MATQRRLPMVGQVLTCREEGCGRKILVESALSGTNHTAATYIKCWEHLNEAERQMVYVTYGLKSTDPS